MSKKEKATLIHGIAASQALDSSGERIMIDGVDISSLVDGNGGTFTYEHKDDQPAQVVGKILEAKKIFKKDDCDNDNHRYFWDKVKIPFIYVAGVLFDSVGHSGAKDVAAMLRFDQEYKGKTRPLINFSIEGSRLAKDGSNILKCIARKVTITITPCNYTASAETMESLNDSKKKVDVFDISKEILSKFKKSEEIEIEILNSQVTDLIMKSTRDYTKIGATHGEKRSASPFEPKRTFTPATAPSKMKVGDRVSYSNSIDKPRGRTGKDLYNDKKTWEKSEKKKIKFYESNMRKAITASCGMGSPSSLTGGAALQKECISREDKHKILKNISEESWNLYKDKESLVEFISEKNPNMSKSEVLAVAKTYSHLEHVKKSKKLSKLIDSENQ